MTRFIVLATGRTGTTLLGNSLADHPQILYYGELFHWEPARRAEEAARRSVGAGFPRMLGSGLPPCAAQGDGAAYLRSLFAQPTQARAVGFKLFYSQARSGQNATAWDLLSADADLRIVHLQRTNWLESLVSRERARRTGIWHTDAPVHTAPFRIEAQQCREHFEKTAQGLSSVGALLGSHAVLDIEYSRMSADFAACMATVCGFLDVDPARAGPARTAKIATRRVSEELSNFEELREVFGGTRYATFFE